MNGWNCLRPAWLLNRRVGMALLVDIAVGAAGGLRRGRREHRRDPMSSGSVDGWQRWLARLGLLLRLAAARSMRRRPGWWWMRRRLLAPSHPPSPSAPARVEIAAVVTIVLLEGQSTAARKAEAGEDVMTLYDGLFGYYLTLVGWIINNGIWNILVASGMFALPFVAIVIHGGCGQGRKARTRATRACCPRCASRTAFGWRSLSSCSPAFPSFRSTSGTIKFGTPALHSARSAFRSPPTRAGQRHHAQQPERAGAGGGGSSCTPSRRPSPGCGGSHPCGTDLRQIAWTWMPPASMTRYWLGGRGLRARLLRPVARQTVHGPADALRRSDERRDLDRFELLPEQRQASTTLTTRARHARLALRRYPRCGELAQVDSGGAIPPASSGGRMAATACRGCWLRSIPTCCRASAGWAGFPSQNEVNDSVIAPWSRRSSRR